MAKLVFKSGPYAGKSIMVPHGRTLTMGRNRDLELPLPDLKLSRRHCQIVSAGEQFILKDLGSTNGTFINGERLSGEIELNDFDRIVLGDTEIEFHHAEKVPLPMNFDPNKADPFGLGDNAAPAVTAPDTATAMQQHKAIGSTPAVEVPEDPFEAALREMLMPLPPEPAPLNFTEEAAARKPKLLFCDLCSGSIPMLDWDLGQARELGGKTVCKDCFDKGVIVQPPAAVAAAQAAAAPQPRKADPKKISDILAALDGEAEVVDTTIKRAGAPVPESRMKLQPSISAPPAAQMAPPKAPDLTADLGEEFEEIK